MNAASVLGIGLVFTLKDEVSNAASKMTQKFQQLNYVSSETAAKMESSLKGIGKGFGLMTAGAAIASPFVAAINVAADFEAQMSNVKAATKASAEQIKSYEASIMKASEATKYSAMEAAMGFETLVKGGMATEKILAGGLTATLNFATAGGIAVDEAASLGIGAMSSFRDEALTMEYISNIMVGGADASVTSVNKISQGLTQAGGKAATVGLTFRDTVTALSALSNHFVEGSDAGTSFKTMLTMLQPQTNQTKALFENLGLTVKGQNQFYQNGVIKPIGEVAQVLQNLTKGKTKEQISQMFTEMFGSDGVRAAIALSKEGAQGMAILQAQMDKIKASEVAAEKLNNFNGALTILKSNLETFMIKVGSNFLPILKSFADRITTVVQAFSAFSETKLGQFAVKLAGGIALAVFALGAFVSTFHAARFAMAATQPVLKMTKIGFDSLAKTFRVLQMAAPIAFDSIKMGFASMRVAAISALTPLLPYLIPIGLAIAVVSAAVYVLVKGYQSFQKVLDGGGAETGFLGFLQKVGGAIHSVITIWKSATNEGFTLSGQFYEALQRIGMEKFALSLGTWIVRVKAFFGGIAERAVNFGSVLGSVWSSFERVGSSLGNAFSAVGKAFTSIISLVVKPFEPLLEMFPEISFYLEKLGGDVEWFAVAGKVAFEAAIFPIRAIATALELVANVITVVVDGIAIFYNFFANTFDSINWYIELFKNDMISLPQLFGMIGNAITHNLLEGIKAGWASITTFMVNSLKALPGGEAIASYLGIGGSGEEQAKQAALAQTGLAGQATSDTTVAPTQANSSFTQKMDTINNASVVKAQQGRQTAQAMETMASAGVNNSTTQVAPIINVNVVAEMDGENIVKKVNSTNQLNDARG